MFHIRSSSRMGGSIHGSNGYYNVSRLGVRSGPVAGVLRPRAESVSPLAQEAPR